MRITTSTMLVSMSSMADFGFSTVFVEQIVHLRMLVDQRYWLAKPTHILMGNCWSVVTTTNKENDNDSIQPTTLDMVPPILLSYILIYVIILVLPGQLIAHGSRPSIDHHQRLMMIKDHRKIDTNRYQVSEISGWYIIIDNTWLIAGNLYLDFLLLRPLHSHNHHNAWCFPQWCILCLHSKYMQYEGKSKTIKL